MIHINSISKMGGNKLLFQKASFQINFGEKVGLVGPNGAGKTTLFRLLVGEERPLEGVISKPDRVVIGYFSQDVAEMKGRSVLQEVMLVSEEIHQIQNQLKFYEEKLCEPLDEEEMNIILEKYGLLQSDFERLGGYDLESRASEILTGLGIGPEEFHRPTETFSGGWKMRIALAKILTLKPDLLLMDEPTNHLDIESIIWLEDWIKNYKGSVFMTSHDREFMNRIVGKIVEVAHQTITTYSGDYDFYEKEKALRREQLKAAASRQEEMLLKEKEFIARFAARASHAAQVQSRIKKIDKIEIIEVPQEEQTMHFDWPMPPRGGDEVVKLVNLGKTWKTHEGKEKLVFSNINALVKRLDRVAVVGVNGAGKSTLLKVVTSQTEASQGKVIIGSGIQIGYFSQNSLDVLDPQSTIVEEVQKHMPKTNLGVIRNLLGAFKFSGDDVDKKISVLSGGEKSRVILATLLASPLNLLVLDEPTNHLDIQSREVLLDAIKQFPGTVMIVSHDRHFLRKITTKVFALSHQELQVTEGSWEYYLEKNGIK